MAHAAVSRGLSQRRACALVGLARASYPLADECGRVARQAADAPDVAAVLALVEQHPGWGFWKYYDRLRKDELRVDHKCWWRLYKAHRLQLGPRRPRRHLPERVKQPLVMAPPPN